MILFDLTKRPTRHSYSSVKKYKECPAAYAFSYIMKMPDEPTAAMMRGTRLHALAEDYMRAGPEVPTPYDIKKVGLKIYQLRENKAQPEVVWRLNAAWEPVQRDEDARLKAIIDVHWMDKKVLRIHDYKSGRAYPDHEAQLDLYSTVGLCVYPDAQRAEASAIYFDSGNEGPERSVIRDMLPYKIRLWTGDLDRIDGDERFLPTPGGHCGRCRYGVSKGGPCDAEQLGVLCCSCNASERNNPTDEMPPPDHKHCSVCREVKPRTAFYHDPRGWTRPACIDCYLEKQRAKRA